MGAYDLPGRYDYGLPGYVAPGGKKGFFYKVFGNRKDRSALWKLISLGLLLGLVALGVVAQRSHESHQRALAQVEKTQMQLNTYKSDLARVRDQMGHVNTQRAQAEGEKRSLQRQLTQFEFSYNATNTGFQELQRDYDELKARFDGVKSEMTNVSDGYVERVAKLVKENAQHRDSFLEAQEMMKLQEQQLQEAKQQAEEWAQKHADASEMHQRVSGHHRTKCDMRISSLMTQLQEVRQRLEHYTKNDPAAVPLPPMDPPIEPQDYAGHPHHPRARSHSERGEPAGHNEKRHLSQEERRAQLTANKPAQGLVAGVIHRDVHAPPPAKKPAVGSMAMHMGMTHEDVEAAAQEADAANAVKHIGMSAGVKHRRHHRADVDGSPDDDRPESGVADHLIGKSAGVRHRPIDGAQGDAAEDYDEEEEDGEYPRAGWPRNDYDDGYDHAEEYYYDRYHYDHDY